MLADGTVEIICAAVMQEEEALADTPQRRGTELPAVGIALGNVVGESRSHVVQGEVAVRLERHIALPGHGGLSCSLVPGVAGLTADIREHLLSSGHRRSRRRRRRR